MILSVPTPTRRPTSPTSFPYTTLFRSTKMIRHLGSSLTDVTYVFDEPTIGLHPHDIQRMNALLRQLRDKGNTVLVVEHKPEMIAIADHVIDLGDRKSTRLNSSHVAISYAVFCLKKKTKQANAGT